MSIHQDLGPREQELQRLGLRVVERSDTRLVGYEKRLRKDLMMIRVATLVDVRKVPEVTVQTLLDAEAELAQRWKDLDDSAWPLWFMKAHFQVQVWMAGSASEGAIARVLQAPTVSFAAPYVAHAILLPDGTAHYRQNVPYFGMLLWERVRYLVSRMVEPSRPPAGDESTAGLVFTIVYGALLAVLFLLLVLTLSMVVLMVFFMVLGMLGAMVALMAGQ